ncbi:DUF6000 family protein [Streptomyces sp. NPDC026206]|uniref:DUF6000 family protein n=1 Tax=Streptomyces sp. NPDC026206 TaxID=3157089 RepID=UPI0033E06416
MPLDQEWALGSLQHIDAINGTDSAQQLLGPGRLWSKWADVEDPDTCWQRVEGFHLLYRLVSRYIPLPARTRRPDGHA